MLENYWARIGSTSAPKVLPPHLAATLLPPFFDNALLNSSLLALMVLRVESCYFHGHEDWSGGDQLEYFSRLCGTEQEKHLD